MTTPIMQHSFHAGEWAPQLNARVDLQKYHSAAALMRNFFVDYRGGASTRMGTRFIAQVKTSAKPVRLITFAASSTVQYVLEFGDLYIRFYFGGQPILEAAKTITGITQANPAVVTSATHGFSNGDRVYILGVGGMTQVNGNYYTVAGVTTNTFQLTNVLDGSNVNSTGYGAYTSGGTVARVYTLTSPYAAADLALVKFVQIVNTMILCHPAYSIQLLTLISANSWTIANLTLGPTVSPPSAGLAIATTTAGAANLSYVVTSVDANGQESSASAVQTTTISAAVNSVTLSWTAVTGAVSYNVYRTAPSFAAALPSGVAFGFIGNTQGVKLVDSWLVNYVPVVASDFSQNAPIFQNPFGGGPVTSLTLTGNGTYTASDGFPVVTIAPPSSGIQALAAATLGTTTVTLANGGGGYAVGQIFTVPGCGGLKIAISAVTGPFASPPNGIASFIVLNAGSLTSGPIPNNPISIGGSVNPAYFNVGWQVATLTLVLGGSGYISGAPPAVTFTGAVPATATSTVLGTNLGAPAVPAFFQERLVLAAPNQVPQGFFMSQPGAPYNFNISFPAQADDAITGTIVSSTLNTIKAMTPMSAGLIMFTDRQAWLVNGGGANAPITPANADANSQAYNGISDVPPIIVNFDILYVQSKGAIVRDLTFNFYTSIYTGTDISVLSSHLFFGFSITQWAFAEEPFKVVWAVRSDGQLLSLTFLKEQEIVGWAHHDTQGTFQSVCSVVESTPNGFVDATYFVVKRTINGNVVQYIERMADRFLGSYKDANTWCVDCGVQYSGAPATSFSGAMNLAGMACVGLADGNVFTATVSSTGTFTLSNPAAIVTIGLSYLPQLQTLPIDVGEPTQQGKRKTINGFMIRVMQALGLSVGRTAGTLVNQKDLQVGNLNIQSNTVVTDLFTGDARTVIDPQWDIYGQVFIQQSNPYPATILGVIPEIQLGDK